MGTYRIEGSVTVADAGSALPNGRGDLSVARNVKARNMREARTVTALSADTTLTAAQILSGIISVDTSGGARTLTLPAVSVLVAGMTNPAAGDVISFLLVAHSHASNAAIIAMDTGATFSSADGSNGRTAGRTSRLTYIRLTSLTAAVVF